MIKNMKISEKVIFRFEKKLIFIEFCLSGFLLAVAYSATIGGLSSLVGTAPNIFVKGFTDRVKQTKIRRLTYCYRFLLFLVNT